MCNDLYVEWGITLCTCRSLERFAGSMHRKQTQTFSANISDIWFNIVYIRWSLVWGSLCYQQSHLLKTSSTNISHFYNSSNQTPQPVLSSTTTIGLYTLCTGIVQIRQNGWGGGVVILKFSQIKPADIPIIYRNSYSWKWLFVQCSTKGTLYSEIFSCSILPNSYNSQI